MCFTWRIFLEDYGVQLHYIKGESNSLADALSRLPFAERQNTPSIPTTNSADALFLQSDLDQLYERLYESNPDEKSDDESSVNFTDPNDVFL